MKLLAQQGFGKGNKINQGLADNSLNGVILSPRDERYTKFDDFISQIKNKDTDILMDPQLYYSTFAGSDDKYLSLCSYYPGNLTASSFRFNAMNKFVKDCFEFQNNLGVTEYISPSILIPNFSDRWAQILLNMADIASSYTGKKVIISVIFQENALNDFNSVNEFLNDLTTLDVDGFYIMVSRNNVIYDQKFENSEALSNLMLMVYSLSEINEYKVILGYTDIIGLLFGAVGAYGVATGWYNSLRKFTVQQRIMPSTGGRSPRDRYTSSPLLNSLLITELESISAIMKRSGGDLSPFLSNTKYDKYIKNGRTPSEQWNRNFSHLQHWSALRNLYDEICDDSLFIDDRLNKLIDKIKTAASLYSILKNYAVQFERPNPDAHLATWLESIKQFKEKANI